ncbi:MAG: hypothetical protein QME94_10800, partial [Anaerolineae bacterium]|nr:hypothetical protein [Anaerolineae bacterium]
MHVRRRPSSLALLLAGLTFALLLACAWPLSRLAAPTSPPPTPAPTRVSAPTSPAETPALAGAGVLPGVSIAEVVRQVRPAVVQIANMQVYAGQFSLPVPQ